MRSTRLRIIAALLLVALMVGILPPGLGGPQVAQAAGAIGLTTLGVPYTQDFNTLASIGTSTTVPLGWDYLETGTGAAANGIYSAGTGSSNAGDTYSFGADNATERAFGGLLSGTVVPTIGVQFTNNTGAAITSLAVSYTGEMWRLGATGRADRLDFQISGNATSLSNGTWTNVDALDFSSPTTAGTIGAQNGNAAAWRTALSFTITGINVANGASLWLRWLDFNPTGSDDGLAVDDFSLTPLGVVADSAPAVASTNPAGGAVNVPVASNIDVTFSEPVNATGASFVVDCGSGALAATVSGGPTTFTLDPAGDLPAAASCTLTVLAAQVSDQDGNDPPDTMTADYTATFNTIAPDAAPTVVSTFPVDGATNVPLDANLSVTFSEPVNVNGGWYTLACSVSGNIAGAVSGGQTSFTIDPSSNFVSGETCTFTIVAGQVSDVDANDPPDTLVVDFVVGFTAADPCILAFTPIYTIQGSGATAAVTGVVTTQGVVVGDYEGPSPALRGFFLQALQGDGDPSTSDGIFVFEGSNANNVSLGDVVRVTGTAGENQGQTQVSIGNITRCGTATVAPTDVTLPVASADFLERYEGMLVRLPQTLNVTEHFQLGRFGQVVLSAGNRLYQPTNLVPPGAQAIALQGQNDLNRLILDDGSQIQNPDPILFARNGQPLSASNTLRGGDTATGIVGVMSFTWAGNAASGNAYRVRPVNALGGSVNFQATNLRPTAAPPVSGRVRVAGMNLLNFFNTFDGLPDNVDNCRNGVGGPATDCRGADNSAEFARQWPKTVAAVKGTQAAIVGVIEIENDGYGADSAIQFLVDQLNAATAPGTYALIDVDARTGQINALGTDAIKVGLVYQPALVTPVGLTAALNSAAFVTGGDSADRNRPALAQAFEENATGARFVVSVNHLKSKGSACNAPDAGDGQGNCAVVRTNAAALLTQWLASDPTATGETDALIVGDLNSYAKETPITTIQAAGYTNLIEAFNGPDAYSYVFDGQWGYLDHALGSAALVPQVAAVYDWHINADEPSVLDYNTDFKTANLINTLYAPDEFRIADHDPVLVDLNPVNAPPTADAGGPYSANEGTSVTLTASGADPEGTNVTFGWDLDNDGVFETAGATATFAAVDGSFSYPVRVQVRDVFGNATTAETVVNVANVAPTVGAITGPNTPVSVNAAAAVSAPFTDPGVLDTHTAVWTWGDGTTSAGTVTEANGSGTASGSHAYTAAGIYTVGLTVTDKDGGAAQTNYQYIVVYDANGGFVTGGGWFNSPAGALTANPAATGKANLGFNAKYDKNSNVPKGQLEFQFKAGNLNFKVQNVAWLVVAGAKAQFSGAGALDGVGGYSYLVTLVDGKLAGGDGQDRIRLRIWNSATGAVVYDTQPGALLTADPTTVLEGGNLVIHDGKIKAADETATVESNNLTDWAAAAYRLFLPNLGK